MTSEDKIKENKRRHYLRHRDEIRARSKRWRLEHPEQAKSNDLKKKYGITLDDWKAMLAAQGGRCANPGCRTTDPGGNYGEWHTDHDHISGKVRGLLCANCNLTLGNAKEDSLRLEGLAAYLRQHGAL